MEETLTAMLNDTRRNPNPHLRTCYTPRTYAYEAGCDESTAVITKNDSTSYFFPSTLIKCKGYVLQLNSDAYDWKPKAASVRTIDSSTFMVITPVINLRMSQIIEAIEPSFVALEHNLCSRFASSDRLDVQSQDFPEDGIIALPKTHATKCQFGSDGSIALSVTYFQFAVGHMQDKITASILDDPTSLPLLKPMYVTINAGAFSSPTNNSTLVILTKTLLPRLMLIFSGACQRIRKNRGIWAFSAIHVDFNDHCQTTDYRSNHCGRSQNGSQYLTITPTPPTKLISLSSTSLKFQN